MGVLFFFKNVQNGCPFLLLCFLLGAFFFFKNVSELTVLLCAATFPVQYRVPIDAREVTMDTISYTAARANLAKTMEKVCNDHDPVIITRKRESPVVMVSLKDFQAMEETAYLLRSPANARHLLESIAELEAGKGTEHELIE